MEQITVFFANNYVFFIVISVILICALVGYLVDVYEKKKGIDRAQQLKEQNEIKMIDFSTVEQNLAVNNEKAKDDLNLSSSSNTQTVPQTDGFISAEQLANMNFDGTGSVTTPENVGVNQVTQDVNIVQSQPYDSTMINQTVESPQQGSQTPTLQIGIEKK